MDQLAARNVALPVLTRPADAGGRGWVHLRDGCIHGAMFAAMAFAMFGGHSAARSVTAGLALTVLAMGLAPLARRSWRMREHLLDVGVMVAVLVLPWLGGMGEAGVMAEHGGRMTHGGVVRGEMATTAPVMVAATVVWLAARAALVVAAGRASRGTHAGAARPHRSDVRTVTSTVATGIGLVIMLIGCW